MTRVGDRVGPYTLVAKKGSGGMGVVWEALDARGRTVALKQMHEHLVDDPELVSRFRREYDIGVSVAHPNLVRMLDYNGSWSLPYLVMEFVGGKSLRRLLDLGGRFYEWEVAVVGAQVADAVGALNSRGVIHRDLKSSNVVIDRDLRVTIIDYGIAKVVGEATMSLAESFIGSAEYSGPELYWNRPVSARSDVYSAGIVLYEMLTGEVPFRSDRYTDTLRMHAELPVPVVLKKNQLVSPEMNALVTSMLQKQPDRRPTAQQVSNVCRSLAEMLGHRAPQRGNSRSGAAAGRTPRPRPHRHTRPRRRPRFETPRRPAEPAESFGGSRQAQAFAYVLAAGLGVALVTIIMAVAAGR